MKEYLMIFFALFLHKNLVCGYSVEASRREVSNEYNTMFFSGELEKIIPEFLPDTPPY